MQVVHVDHFGPLELAKNGYRHILVVIEAFSRFVWLVPIKSTGSAETIRSLESVFNIFGKPTELVSDRGTHRGIHLS